MIGITFFEIFWGTVVASAIALWAYFYWRQERKVDWWLKQYWSLKESRSRVLSKFFGWLALLCWLVALFDPRGPSQNMEGQQQRKKTLILLDNSLSMLVEDIRPSRLQKAVLLARHLIKNLPGHDVSVLLFSETTARYVPFTSDIELLDARLQGLTTEMNPQAGASNIIQALREGAQYLKGQGVNEGSIVVLSDADGMDQEFELNSKLFADYPVAFLAVATAQGGPIPLRDEQGMLKDYKRYQGNVVQSALQEDFLKKLVAQLPLAQYWVVSTFTVPTQELLNFINQKASKDLRKASARFRPSYAFMPILLGLIFLALSWWLKLSRAWRPHDWPNDFKPNDYKVAGRASWQLILILLLMGFFSHQGWGDQEKKEKQKVAVATVDPKVATLKQLWKEQGLTPVQLNYLGLDLIKKKEWAVAHQYYEQLLVKAKEDLPYEWYNFALVISQWRKKGMYDHLFKVQSLMLEHQHTEKIYRESLMALVAQQQQQNQKQDQKDQQEQDKKQEGEQQTEQDQQGSSDQKKQDDKGSEGQEKNKEQEQNKKENKEEENKSENKKDDKEKSDTNDEKNKENKGQEKQPDQQKDNLAQQPKQQSKGEQQKTAQQRKKELSPLLLQLLNDDRNLQQKLLDTTTKEKGAHEQKDW